MKKVLLLLSLFFSLSLFAQLPPPGLGSLDCVDIDNDGFTSFEIDIYLNSIRTRALTVNTGYDLSGYELILFPSETDYNNNTNAIVTPNYTNVIPFEQFCYLKLNYTGFGTEYNQGDLNYYFSGHKLRAIPYNGDIESDGVVNGIEDLNGNLRLADDDTDVDGIANYLDLDDDGDGVDTINEDYNNNGNLLDDDLNSNSIPDYLDNSVALSTNENDIVNIKIFPNPVSSTLFINGFNTEYNFSIIGVTGKIILKSKSSSNSLDVSELNSGIYILKIDFDNHFIIKKFIKD